MQQGPGSKETAPVTHNNSNHGIVAVWSALELLKNTVSALASASRHAQPLLNPADERKTLANVPKNTTVAGDGRWKNVALLVSSALLQHASKLSRHLNQRHVPNTTTFLRCLTTC